MTIEELVGKSAEELEKMSDKDILEHFKDALQFTRFDSPKAIAANTARRSSNGKLILGGGATTVSIGGVKMQLTPQRALAIANIGKELGLDLKDLGVKKTK